MAGENLESVRAGYEEIGRGDVDALLVRWSPDVVVHDASRPDPTTADGDWVGHDAVRRYVGDWEESFEESRAEILETAETEQSILLKVRTRAHGRGSGIDIENERFHVFDLRGGLVVRFGVYADEAEARAAAGL